MSLQWGKLERFTRNGITAGFPDDPFSATFSAEMKALLMTELAQVKQSNIYVQFAINAQTY
jgi:hypothetical protein